MSRQSHHSTVSSLQKRWSRQLLFANVLLAVSVAVLVSFIAFNFFAASSWLLAFVFLFVLAAIFFSVKQNVREPDIILYLNQIEKGFEESAHLLTKPAEELDLLEQLQLAKIYSRADGKIATPAAIQRKIKGFSLILISVLVLVVAWSVFPFIHKPYRQESISKNENGSLLKTKMVLPQVKDATIIITPPFYTHKPSRQQQQFNIVAEQKARVSWVITTTQKVKEIYLLLNDKSVLSLRTTNKEQTQWRADKAITASGFYQLIIDGKSSQLYTIEMIRDGPPVINIISPAPNTFIKLGEERKTNVVVSLSDDYGIDSTYLTATLASGSGEAVTFKQLKMPFAGFIQGSKKENLQKLLNLAAIGMGDGDELYFYITATDNNNQQKRSDVYIVRLEDSTQLMSLPGMVNGLDIKPELFRSERQIIIETEQLLKDKDTISESKFNEQSDRLGTDQQLLRLRYGKYLGEETESEIQPSTNNSNDLSDFGNAAKVIDEYSDKHDAAEDANFFDAPTKKQLQLMLTEMWKASLQLKTYKPKDALPFEYNALRLLKDLQQKTRAYVAKTGVKTTPLQVEKRLSGELDKIIQPEVKENRKFNDSSTIILRKGLAILEKIRSGEVLQSNDKSVLQDALPMLNNKAVLEPAAYLPAYQSLQKIGGNIYQPIDITLVGKAFQKMIQKMRSVPQSPATTADMNLSQRYFINLTKQRSGVE